MARIVSDVVNAPYNARFGSSFGAFFVESRRSEILAAIFCIGTTILRDDCALSSLPFAQPNQTGADQA